MDWESGTDISCLQEKHAAVVVGWSAAAAGSIIIIGGLQLGLQNFAGQLERWGPSIRQRGSRARGSQKEKERPRFAFKFFEGRG